MQRNMWCTVDCNLSIENIGFVIAKHYQWQERVEMCCWQHNSRCRYWNYFNSQRWTKLPRSLWPSLSETIVASGDTARGSNLYIYACSKPFRVIFPMLSCMHDQHARSNINHCHRRWIRKLEDTMSKEEREDLKAKAIESGFQMVRKYQDSTGRTRVFPVSTDFMVAVVRVSEQNPKPLLVRLFVYFHDSMRYHIFQRV